MHANEYQLKDGEQAIKSSSWRIEFVVGGEWKVPSLTL